MPRKIPQETARLIVTSSGLASDRDTRSAFKAAFPSARIRRMGFKGIFGLEAEGDVFELAQRIYKDCRPWVGHVTAVLAEVESRLEPVKEAAVRLGREQIGSEDSFSFRIHKLGTHFLERDSLTIEQEIGGEIWKALEQKHGGRPQVRLKEPDVAIVAEVLGSKTAVGVSRGSWRRAA